MAQFVEWLVSLTVLLANVVGVFPALLLALLVPMAGGLAWYIGVKRLGYGKKTAWIGLGTAIALSLASVSLVGYVVYWLLFFTGSH